MNGLSGPWRVRLAAFAVVIAAGCSGSPPSAEIPSQRLAPLEARLIQLQTNLERIEGVRAIKRVQLSYGHYSEFGLWHDFADLFSDQAVGNYPVGVLIGREQIRTRFYKEVGQNLLGLADGRLYPHIVLSPVVTLGDDGQSAKGRWRILAMLGGYGRSASWAGGSYENQYVRENGVWKMSELSFFSQYGGRYDEGLKPAASSGPPHFGVAQAGAPLSVVRASTTTGADFATLANRLSEIESRVQVLSDEAEVTNLQHRYGYHFDRKEWVDLVDLFAADGTLELGQRGVYLGRDRIRRALSLFNGDEVRDGEVHDHLQMQTIVTIAPDGLSARARSTELSMAGMRDAGAQWGEGIYENEFVKDDGRWKIRAVHFYPRVVTDYKEGWARSALPTPGPNSAFPPDRPPTVRYEVYPKFFIPPFHYVHPVTGKPAQYPDGYAHAVSAPMSVQPGPRPVAPKSLGELQSRLERAEFALARAAAYDAAENLVDAYTHFLDERMFGEAAALFAAGPERVRQSLETAFASRGKPPVFMAIHKVAQPVIDVADDGRSARVRSRLFQIETWADRDDLLAAGHYDSKLVEQNGSWRFESLQLEYTWRAGYREGWASPRPSSSFDTP